MFQRDIQSHLNDLARKIKTLIKETPDLPAYEIGFFRDEKGDGIKIRFLKEETTERP